VDFIAIINNNLEMEVSNQPVMQSYRDKHWQMNSANSPEVTIYGMNSEQLKCIRYQWFLYDRPKRENKKGIILSGTAIVTFGLSQTG